MEFKSLESRFDSIFDEKRRADLLTECLAQLIENDALRRFSYRYVTFNGVFAAGVVGLTSALHSRSDIFRDEVDPNGLTADRSAEVASHVFHAAEDEYRVHGARIEVTHRTLAQQFLRRIDTYLGVDQSSFPRVLDEPVMMECLDCVRRGYGGGRTLDDSEVFFGLGFHLASEQFASQEFTTLDRFLRKTHPHLVDRLNIVREQWGMNGYYWIQVHCNVEEDHWRAAIKAIDCSLQFYCGTMPSASLADRLVDGYRAFAAMQDVFFKYAVAG